MGILKTARNAAITIYAALTLNPTDAIGQNVPERNIPKSDPKTFLTEDGHPLFKAAQYDINLNDPSGPRNVEKQFLKGLEEDGVILDRKEYKSIVPKMGSRTLDAVVQRTGYVELYLSDGAAIEDRTQSSFDLHPTITHEMQTFKDNGNGALDGGDKPVDRTLRITTPLNVPLSDENGQVNRDKMTVVNIVYQDLENDPDNFYMYRAYVDAQGNQITTDDQGNRLQGIGALKFMPESEEARQAFEDLVWRNAYPDGITDFREFLNGYILDIYHKHHKHHKNGGDPPEIVTDFDFLNGNLREIGPIVTGKEARNTLQPEVLDRADIFGFNKGDIMPTSTQPLSAKPKLKTGF